MEEREERERGIDVEKREEEREDEKGIESVGQLDCFFFTLVMWLVTVAPLLFLPPAIQRRGCLLIRLLCVPEYLTSRSLCTSVANVVVNALSRWKTAPEVQIEVSRQRFTEIY